MPIQFTYDSELGILVTKAEGEVSIEEIQRHIEQEVAAGAIGDPEVFDASDAFVRLTPAEVRKISEAVHALMQSAPFGPTAVVTRSEVFFGMARMLEIISDLQGGPRFSVFKDFDEAVAWLCAPR
jgi:hypothetical protein